MSEPEIAKAIGFEADPVPVSWNQRDLLLYAVGIGAKSDELHHTYELSKNWQPFPTYPLVLGLKGHKASVSNFAEALNGRGKNAPGMPKLDPNRVVHAEQSIQILKPIPHDASAEDGWKLINKIVGVTDRGKGLILDQMSVLVDGKGTEYSRMVSSSFNFGKFDYGGFKKSIAPKLKVQSKSKPPAKDPNFKVSEKTTEEQATLYRLSGDYNPLHIDPAIGKAMNFGGVILHGLCSYGHAARAIVKTVCENDGSRLVEMTGRFTSPVKPGDTLETLIWITEDDAGLIVDFVQQIKESGKPCIVGAALVKKQRGGAKL